MIDASKVKVGDKLLMEVEVTYREGEIVKVKSCRTSKVFEERLVLAGGHGSMHISRFKERIPAPKPKPSECPVGTIIHINNFTQYVREIRGFVDDCVVLYSKDTDNYAMLRRNHVDNNYTVVT